jgi:pheromone shutdown-related protein TraB
VADEGQVAGTPSGAGAAAEDDVHRLAVDGREFVVVGTAHVSRESTALVERVIERERPDCVCVELDPRRYDGLAHRARLESLDLKTIIRNRQLVPLLLNLLLMSYQKQLGGQLGVVPGGELLAAAEIAERFGIPVRLCDRDVRVTLRRAWAALSLWHKAELIATLLAAVFEAPQLDEQELRRLRQQDVLTRLMEELGAAFPGIKRVLIDERDAYLATRLREAPGARVVAVVGAGHVAGMLEALRGDRRADLAALDAVPPPSTAARIAGWSIPVALGAGLAAIGLRNGLTAVGDNALFWILATGLPGVIGAALALGHPLTLLATFLSAPITTLSPLLGVGYVAALVQAWVRPPLVREIQSVAEDVRVPYRWWRNRLLRICLVFLLSTVGTSMGTIVGTTEIFLNLFH